MVPPRSDRISRVPPYSRIVDCLTRTGLSPTMAKLSRIFRLTLDNHWPGPRSLATTNGVSVDVLSSGYLDVSVPRVCLKPLFYSGLYTSLLTIGSQRPHLIAQARARSSNHRRWVSPFRNPRIKACSQLPMAYRSVPRLSSPLSAKASTERPYDT